MMNKMLRMVLFSAAALGALDARGAERLKGEASAFLKEFVDSPVDWMPWGDAAIARAKAEQRPVFLFIGSFTSELSGAMRRQTFANVKNADWLNKNFVCVIVDRDERPDVAALYQGYVLTLKQLNGWPLNVWLTPEFQPFEGATYLSPSEDWGAPGFLKLANQAQTAWTTNPAACRKRASEALTQLAPPAHPPAPPVWSLDKARARLAASSAAWRAVADPENGGFGDVPRSPEPELLRFMLLQAPVDRDAALATLRALAASAVRDPLDGGFFRHGSDAAWHIPYQQKMLADQARIALAYLDAARGTDAKQFRLCARGALDFVLSRLSLPDGTFASAQDATGDEYTGYYTWSAAEIETVLGTGSLAFDAAHGVQPDGNVPAADDPSAQFAHRNFLRSAPDPGIADAAAAARLLAARNRRPGPRIDPRATAGANGLLLSAMARAGVQLNDIRYIAAARRILVTIRDGFQVAPNGTLRRMRGSSLPASAVDYAAVALGCRDYAVAVNDQAAMAYSGRVLAQLDARYLDPATSAFFGAPNPTGPGFFMRPFGPDDPPSAESLAVAAHDAHAQAIAAALSDSLEESSAQTPGDQLLAIAQYCLTGPVEGH
jgi:uncharacterized protein YyaL (SSP411 family)